MKTQISFGFISIYGEGVENFIDIKQDIILPFISSVAGTDAQDQFAILQLLRCHKCDGSCHAVLKDV